MIEKSPVSPVIWEMAGRELRVRCELHPHPLGVEVRVLANGELQRSHVHRTRAEAIKDLDETRTRCSSTDSLHSQRMSNEDEGRR